MGSCGYAFISSRWDRVDWLGHEQGFQERGGYMGLGCSEVVSVPRGLPGVLRLCVYFFAVGHGGLVGSRAGLPEERWLNGVGMFGGALGAKRLAWGPGVMQFFRRVGHGGLVGLRVGLVRTGGAALGGVTVRVGVSMPTRGCLV
jgi:hypothetical protein